MRKGKRKREVEERKWKREDKEGKWRRQISKRKVEGNGGGEVKKRK